MSKTTATVLKVLAYAAKAFGLVSALNVIPFVPPATGAIIFFAASLGKDTINRLGDFLDDGKENKSWPAAS